jgi:hypothetical protein
MKLAAHRVENPQSAIRDETNQICTILAAYHPEFLKSLWSPLVPGGKLLLPSEHRDSLR